MCPLNNYNDQRSEHRSRRLQKQTVAGAQINKQTNLLQFDSIKLNSIDEMMVYVKQSDGE